MTGTKIFRGQIFLVAIFAFFAFTISADNPQAGISNGIISAKLFLPDTENGYYRASRFDWSGQISELKFKGHNFFGLWYEKYDPMLHDAIMGPVEAFDPIGYDSTPVGGTFVKIGVGALERNADKPYHFASSYKLVNPGKWTIKKASDKIKFTHTLNDTTVSYVYSKTVQLVKGKPQLVLLHSLKNTGTQPIETNVMNHNFFVIDTQVTGSDFEVTLPFEPVATPGDEKLASTISGNQIVLEDEPAGKNYYLGPITGYSTLPTDYDITIKNRKTGAGVNVKSDRPFSRLAFWATVKTVCPEPFIHVKAEPGKEFTWTTTYTFFAAPSGGNAN